MPIPGWSEQVENLFLLTNNRKEGNIFLLSANQVRLITAMENGFCVVPIMQYSDITIDTDIQLNLVENYLLKLRYFSDLKSKNDIDFGFLKEKQESRKQLKQKLNSCSVYNYSNNF